VWGGGDPGTFYPDRSAPSSLVDFLKSTSKKIIFSDAHFTAERYGTGWAWDDYQYSFQQERTAFPVLGNRLWVDRYADSIVIKPDYFYFVTSTRQDTVDKIERNEEGTEYRYSYIKGQQEDHVTIPVSLLENDVRFIWKEVTGKEIQFAEIPLPGNTLRINGSNRDSLLRYMMHESDNFIAEQMLLACALTQTGEMNDTEIIEKVLSGPLAGLPDKISWVDGSGLSRYNLMTPRSAIFVLQKMIDKKGIDYIKEIFPAGGESGTIIDWYKSKSGRPYLFAKTGTLNNTHCLTGILLTNSGKVLLFSWMHNQFGKDSITVKRSMEKLFTWLRDNY